MNRSRLLVLLAVLAAAVVAILLLLRGSDAPPPAPTTPVAVGTQPEATPVASTPVQPATPMLRREDVTQPKTDGDLDDPEIRAALSGFTGRIVNAGKQPVADTGVRIYRFAADSLFRPGLDLMRESDFTPEYVAGETRTAGDGRFTITGIWPRAVYLLLGGIGGDAPTHRVLQRSPAPGEVIDLGDIVLEDAAVVTGIVVDEDGQPVADALVRGADLPGQLVSLFPVERFDPDGCLLIREQGGPPVPVIEFPKWVKTAFERLPIPTTHTDQDGHFRLVGLVPGSNMIAVTKPGFLARVEPAVPLKPAQEKDLGTLRLKLGEELVGKVLDLQGKPIAGAEVVAGGTLAMAPVDFGVRVGRSDQNGEFHADGFPAGMVTVAARRDKGQPWTLAEPQSINGTVTVQLPSQFAMTIAVTTAAGAPVQKPELRLMSGGREGRDGMLEMAMLGFAPSVDLQDRLQTLEDGRLRISKLDAGNYCLLAQAEGTAIGVQHVELKVDSDVVVKLPERLEYVVQVLDPEGKGIRNAAIYIEERGEGRQIDMPICCGRTKPDGFLTITQAHGETIRLSASHPRWGTVNGECTKAQGSVVLRMQAPGGILGVVTEDRKPAPAAKFTVVIERRSDTRGAIEEIPQLCANGKDGVFEVRALQPGKYRLQLLKSLDALSSPGGVYGLVQKAMFDDSLPSTTVEVLAGQTAEVALDASPEVLTGPSGHVYGMVTIDGRPGADCTVMCWGGRRSGARCDAAGRFDLGRLPAGNVNVNVSLSGDMFGGNGERYNRSFELKDGEEKELVIDVQTASISGWVTLADGSAAIGVHVSANGQLSGPDGKTDGMGNTWCSTRTGQDGAFHFDKLPVGRYQLDVRGNDGNGRGRVENLELAAGQSLSDVRIQLAPVVKVKGRVELAVLGAKKPQWIWIQFMAQSKPGEPNAPYDRYVDSTSCDRSGDFSTEDLPPGTYRAFLYSANDNQPQQRYEHQGDIVVPAQGLDNLILVPVAVPEPQRRGG